MKIVISSSIYNHYQKAFVEALQSIEGVEVCFIASEAIPEDRIKLGFSGNANDDKFIIKAYEQKEKAYEEAIQADVLICTWKDREYLRTRQKEGKLTFIYSERILKRDFDTPKCYIKNFLRFIKYRFKKITQVGDKLQFLCYGRYSVNDHLLFGINPKNIYLFGYFPALSESNVNRSYRKDGKVRFLWTGRLLGWKYPMDAVKAMKLLVDKGYKDIELIFVGNGPEESRLQEASKQLGLEEYIKFVGSKPHEEVRKYMQELDVFLFTSGLGEGWGVTLNEAMSEQMAVVASDGAGATTCLVEDKKNGLVYPAGDVQRLADSMERYIDKEQLIKTIAEEGRKSIETVWNANVAARNLCSIIDAINQGKKPEIPYGPGSQVGKYTTNG